MAIIDVYNKKRNVTYVYDSTSYWDKDLKQPRSHRKLIGKRDPVTGDIVPTGTRGRRKAIQDSENSSANSETADPQYSKALETITKKDQTILELRQQLAAAERENFRLRQIITQVNGLLTKATEKVSEASQS